MAINKHSRGLFTDLYQGDFWVFLRVSVFIQKTGESYGCFKN